MATTAHGRVVALVGAVSLMVLTAFEILSYPEASTAIFNWIEGHGWDGSGLRFFATFELAPFAVVYVVGAIGAIAWASRRGRTVFWAVAVAYLTNVILYALSIVYYYTMTQAALRG